MDTAGVTTAPAASSTSGLRMTFQAVKSRPPVTMLMAGMMGIDASLFEAAEVDGATSMQTFWHITIPLLKPMLVYTCINALIGGLQMYDLPQILTNGNGEPDRTTMTLIMYLNKHLFNQNYGMAGALSVMIFIITGALSLLVFRALNADRKKDK